MIGQLDAECSARITAHQVISDLDGCIKELIDNSIDAGASRISVSISGYKSTKKQPQERVIVVSDNGSGILGSDLQMVGMKSATSKLRDYDELYETTKDQGLGFRGEALHAICACSQSVSIASKSEADNSWSEVCFKSGVRDEVIEPRSPIGSIYQGESSGTLVSVCGLFDLLPVRVKHLQNTYQASLRKVVDTVEAYAVSYPGIQFSLVIEGVSSVTTSGLAKTCLEAYQELHGDIPVLCYVDEKEPVPGQMARYKEVSNTQYSIEPSQGPSETAKKRPEGISVTGWIGKAPENCSSRPPQYLVMNGRPVSASYDLLKGISRICSRHTEPATKRNGQPPIVLVVHVPADQIDFSASKSKREPVLLRSAHASIIEMVQRALQASLSKMPPILLKEPLNTLRVLNTPLRTQPTIRKAEDSSFSLAVVDTENEVLIPCTPSPRNCLLPSPLECAVLDKQSFRDVRIIGQVNKGFILTRLCCTQQLIIVDQHAADEKRIFEELHESIVVSRQPLLRPIELHVTSQEYLTIADNREFLVECGVEISLNDGNTLLLTTSPIIAGMGVSRCELNPGRLVRDVCTALESQPGERVHTGTTASKFLALSSSELRVTMASRACRSAIMIGDSLNYDQMQGIVCRLASLRDPWSCPHGRPTVKHVNSSIPTKSSVFR